MVSSVITIHRPSGSTPDSRLGGLGFEPETYMIMGLAEITVLDFVVQARHWSNMSTGGRHCSKVEVVVIGGLS